MTPIDRIQCLRYKCFANKGDTVTSKERKQKYWDKVYANAELIPCKCGCGTMIKSKDRYGRNKSYENGHNKRKYDDPTQYKREWNHKHREDRQALKTLFGRKRKEELVLLKGGKCKMCGVEYTKENTAIFDFHHRDKNSREFRLNTTTLINTNMKAILKELEKCDLLCANCHRLLHYWEVADTE